MTAAERIRFLDLAGEAFHAWLRKVGELEKFRTVDLPMWYYSWLDDRMDRTQPELARTFRELSDDDLTYIWRYARCRAIVHDLKH